jgi:hypothetical protein
MRTFSVEEDRTKRRSQARGGRSAGTVYDDAMPARVHVFEDYETEIEKRWWLRGVEETVDVPKSLSTQILNRRVFRAAETKDFDDLQGDQNQKLKAVIFNPVPGPPMGANTRLRFRYHLSGGDKFRVQIYSLTNEYHRKLELTGMKQDAWTTATVDMTQLRRPDGTGGPLSTDERIDDIQFYVEPAAKLLIDDIVLYEAGEKRMENRGSGIEGKEQGEERFPARIIFTGWFDTGNQGERHEWPGEFSIVPHEKPRTWKAAQSIVDKKTKQQVIRIDLRGPRPIGDVASLRFDYRRKAKGTVTVRLLNTYLGAVWTAKPIEVSGTEWTTCNLELGNDPRTHLVEPTVERPMQADHLEFIADGDGEFQIDDVLLYEKAKP